MKKEKDEILLEMKRQNESLKQTISALSDVMKQMSKPAPAPPPKPEPEPEPVKIAAPKPPKRKPSIPVEKEEAVESMPRVKLPLDVRTWRNAHVLAWLAFHLELPQYMESFGHASVDGLVLTKHVTAETLRNSLNVLEELHVQKIMEGIGLLQDRQKKIDENSEIERLQRYRRKKEEEDYARKVLEEQKQQRLLQLKLQQKQKQHLAASGNAPPKERNIILRKKMERDIRLNKTEQLHKQQTDSKKAATWNFEYTGGMPPVQHDLNLADTEDLIPKGATGTKGYSKVMTLDMLDPQRLDETLPELAGTIHAKPRVEMKEVPISCSTGD